MWESKGPILKWSANRNGSMITAGYRVERMLYSTIDELINFMVKCARLCVCVLCWNWVRQNHIVGQHTLFFSWHRKIGKVESNHPSFGFFILPKPKTCNKRRRIFLPVLNADTYQIGSFITLLKIGDSFFGGKVWHSERYLVLVCKILVIIVSFSI